MGTANAFRSACAGVILLLAGCAGMTPEERAAQESFEPVAEIPGELAVLYVYRERRDGLWLMNLMLNGRLVAAIPESTRSSRYIPFFVPPGELVVESILVPTGWERDLIGDNRALPATLNIEPGQEYYVAKSKGGAN